jgi:hypothetical protein
MSSSAIAQNWTLSPLYAGYEAARARVVSTIDFILQHLP